MWINTHATYYCSIQKLHMRTNCELMMRSPLRLCTNETWPPHRTIQKPPTAWQSCVKSCGHFDWGGFLTQSWVFVICGVRLDDLTQNTEPDHGGLRRTCQCYWRIETDFEQWRPKQIQLRAAIFLLKSTSSFFSFFSSSFIFMVLCHVQECWQVVRVNGWCH